MAFDIFTEKEIKIVKKLTLIGLLIVVGVAMGSGVIHVIRVYTSEGKAGLSGLIQGSKGTTEDTLKKTIDTEITKKPAAQQPMKGEIPLGLSIPSLGINSQIENPGPASVNVLDAALSRGPVYYSGSGYPGVRNMLIFGHSTGFSVVRNKAYKVFNNIKNGKVGELIYVQSQSGISTYKITNVKKVSKYNTWIRFESDAPMLTLATCDSFGKASDRFVLEASFVSFVESK